MKKKKKCDVHYENLQFYLRLGFKLKKIYRLLELNQSHRLKLYVEFNTKNRIEAEKKGEKDKKNVLQINEQYCI